MNGPIMRAQDDEREQVLTLTKEQKKAFAVMAAVQIVMIVLTYALFALQMVTNIKFGVGCIATVIIFMVFYLNFLKLEGLVADSGIKIAWVRLMRVLNPLLFFAAFILCVTTMVG